MNKQVDYSARPDFGDYLRRMGSSDLRFLFDRMCPVFNRPDTPDEMISILSSPSVALGALAQATQDLIVVVASIQALEGSATVADLLSVSFWASHADAGFHEFNEAVSTERPQLTEPELIELLEDAAKIGLVFEMPKGVWNVPDHISDQLVREYTLSYPVHEWLAEERHILISRMEDLGLLDDIEILSEDNLLARLREYLCSPRRVRAIVSTAPADIRKELYWFAQHGVDEEGHEWSDLRRRAMDWAQLYLLGRNIPSYPSGEDAGTGEDEDDDLAYYDPQFYGTLFAPVALALKGSSWCIPIEHERETAPGVHEGAELDDLAVGAVAIATAYMSAAGNGDDELSRNALRGIQEDFEVLSGPGRARVQDFAVSIGADPHATERVVDLLLSAGMLDSATGNPTELALRRWYSATPAARWAILAVGWLTGRPPEVPPVPFVDEFMDLERANVLTEGYRTITRDLVLLAAELEPGMMWYRCCVGSYLHFRHAVLCEVAGVPAEDFFHWVQLGAAELGIFGYGQSHWQAVALVNGLHDVWLTEQNPTLEEMFDLVAPFAEGMLPGSKAMQVSRAPADYPLEARVSIVLEGAISDSLQYSLDVVADRERTGATSEWVVTEESLARALRQVEGDVEKLFAQLGPLNARQMKILLMAEMTRAAGSEKLWQLLMLPSASPDAGPLHHDEDIDGRGGSEYVDGDRDGGDSSSDDLDGDRDGGGDASGDPVQLRLF